jgi:phosphoglycerate dehydrogenase-like enzyme
MPAAKIAILDDYQRVALGLADWRSLGPQVELHVFDTPARDEDDLVRRLAPFDIVVAMRERTAFPASVIERLPRLRLLASTGLRNAAIDVEACRRRGIVVSGARGARNGLAGTSEVAWALILALHKRLVSSHAALLEGRWQPELAQTVDGKVLGIVGLGNIGRRMARIGRAFGMEPVAWSPNLTDERAAEAGVRRVDKAELFATADVVSLHLVLSDRTRGIVSAAELDAMQRSAFLVNTARAGLIDEPALIAALRDRRIAGAGLDVFWQEPLPASHPLCSMDNVVLAPHLGYATPENLAAFYAGVVESIRAWLDGRDVTPLSA